MKNMDIFNISINNNDYRYTSYKHTTSNDVGIFLLGALQEIESVDFFSQHFSKTLNTITIEAPGTGHNHPIPATVSIREQTNMLMDLLEHLNIKKAHVFAFSYATSIAIELCDQWDGVKTLSIACGIPGIQGPMRLKTLDVVAAATKSKREFANTFVDVLSIEHPDIPRSKAIRRSIIASVMKYEQHRVESFMENTIRLMAWQHPDLACINVPTLVLTTEHDPYVTKDMAFDFYQQLKQGYFVVLKNADHLVHLQQPEKMAEALITLAKQQQLTEESFKQF